MKMFKHVVSFVILSVAILGLGFTAGCAGTAKVAPNGVYQGDTFLYQAEKLQVQTHELFQTFLKWEKDWRQVLPVEVSRAADHIRLNEEKWMHSLNTVHDAYVATPTPENKDKYQLTLNIVKAALNEAQFWMLNKKGVAPNEGLPNAKALGIVATLPPPLPSN